jgi:hypothetical protein
LAFDLETEVGQARRAAIHVLLHNARGGRAGLPRTAGWGYPEPYTRDLMIGSLGIMASGNEELAASLGRTLAALAEHQSPLGLIPGIADEAEDLGASDTTPLFLIGLAAYRSISRSPGHLEDAAQRALAWCEYQSPEDRVLVAQQPTSDWRDEQWVPGHGLYVNALVHGSLVLFGHGARAATLREEMSLPVGSEQAPRHTRGGLALSERPYLALWSHKNDHSPRFDLLGNSLAILCGAVSHERAVATLSWVEEVCGTMRVSGELVAGTTPNLIPSISRGEADWRSRYEDFNQPGEYHNGGIWPFVSGFHVAALVAADQLALAEQKLIELTALCKKKKNGELDFGFNEWVRASDGSPRGEDYQFWSASMYLYACGCVEAGRTLLFEAVRTQSCAPTPGPVPSI